MQKLQLYIEGERVDMFEDETVSLTQTIQNIKDISKIFTDFSKTFSLPASKTNNKIFKHYYNYDIVSGFDGRTKKDSFIELNSLPFRTGKMKLEGVDLKNNLAHTYKVTFFGSTVTLKDLLGEDKLSNLNSLNSLNQVYSPAGVLAGLKLNPLTNDVVVPLITHTERLFYDSVTHASGGNLYWESGHPEHGVGWDELKYSLRIHNIIEAIQTRYGIVFSDDFFSASNERYYNLFMWLHRKKGDVIAGTQLVEYSRLVNGWANGFGNILNMTNSSTAEIENSSPLEYVDTFDLTLTRATSEPYSISILRNGVQIYNESNILSTNKVIDLKDYTESQAEYNVILTYGTVITFTSIEWELIYSYPDDTTTTDTYSTGTFSVSEQFEFIITEQIPDIKIIDLLTGLFKMFNLTAFIENNTGVIKVLPLNDFYTTYNSYDISQYIDSDSSSINVALPYREISFFYEDTNTFFAKTHNQLFGVDWSKIDYTQQPVDGKAIDGELYSVSAPFSILKFERLFDVSDSSLTTIQWGYCVDDNQDPYIGKPILFYPILNAIQDNGVSKSISFIDGVGTHSELSASIVMPSNAVNFSTDVTTANINFNAEKNEYQGSTFTNTLFKTFYENYIISVFNPQNRLTNVTAILPLRILLNYTLADRFIINNRSFKINSITTNLNTGKSEIELLNDL
jgi:hypothetical protein